MDFEPTDAAKNHRSQGLAQAKNDKEVKEMARKTVIMEEGNVNDDLEILASHEIQFTHYYGQTFKWLLENDLDFCGWLCSDVLSKKENLSHPSSIMANKKAFVTYMMHFEQVSLCTLCCF